MFTIEEVRKALNLVPFEGFSRKAQSDPDRMKIASEMLAGPKAVFLGPRQTGRTTRMICSALAVASAGRRVSISAKPQPLEHAIKDRAQEMATKLGINPKLIVGHLATADVEFFDHTWYES